MIKHDNIYIIEFWYDKKYIFQFKFKLLNKILIKKKKKKRLLK